ncbi:hypothetical protein SBADM41S_04029 [Streptomyces badius]
MEAALTGLPSALAIVTGTPEAVAARTKMEAGRACRPSAQPTFTRRSAMVLPFTYQRLSRPVSHAVRGAVPGLLPSGPRRLWPWEAYAGTESGHHAYPDHWEADVVLRDGGTARIRPITTDDAERLVSFYEQVSDESKYYRFFAPYPRLSDRDVHRFTQHDYVDRVGLAVTIGGEFIGTVRYDRIDDRGRPPPPPPTRPRSPSSSRTPTRAAESPRRCSNTSPRSPVSAASGASPPRCSPPTTK